MDRRRFLAKTSCLLAPAATARLFPAGRLWTQPAQTQSHVAPPSGACWLDVCAPFIVEDAEKGVHSEIVLTSDTFAGSRGYEDGADATEYEIYLYDAIGKAIGREGIAARITVPALRTTVIAARDLIGGKNHFWGGMKIRLRPKCRETMHASDLFSSAFVRWQTAGSFDNVHANPDPLGWQNTESYYYSMPFPSLGEYDCVFSLFNPYDQPSKGEIVVHDPNGKQITLLPYELEPHASLLFDLQAGKYIHNPWTNLESESKSGDHGLLAIKNEPGTAKSFGYLMIRQRKRERFSVEHPIHQGVFKPKPAVVPFDENNQFRAKNVLYSPLLFNARRIATSRGSLTFDSRIYLGTGLGLEEAQWFYPFAIDGRGEVAWSALNDAKLKTCMPDKTERGVIRLAAGQSCQLDFKKLSLNDNFSGGLALAVSPDTAHTLFKVEIRVQEWGAHAFTHFRPGLRSARIYQKPTQRGGLASDYIVSGARLLKQQESVELDELIGVMNIDDKEIDARPVIEIFGSHGLVAKIRLDTIKAFACRHYLLSELMAGAMSHETFTLRLVDEKATLLMSAVHLDHTRRDIALDHGSDRFSTFLDYGCQ